MVEIRDIVIWIGQWKYKPKRWIRRCLLDVLNGLKVEMINIGLRVAQILRFSV